MLLRKYVIFFFFKQKTAYEIKECDWSSDVCSSDLIATVLSRYKQPPLTAIGDTVRIATTQSRATSIIGFAGLTYAALEPQAARSEERRVGKECRSRWSPYH